MKGKWEEKSRKTRGKKKKHIIFLVVSFLLFFYYEISYLFEYGLGERERMRNVYDFNFYFFKKATLKITKREFIRVTMEPKRRRITKSHVLVIKYTSGHTHTHKSQRIKLNFLFIYLI